MTRESVKQSISHKPLKLARFLKFNESKKRKFGKSVSSCRKCGRHEGLIRKYDLLFCRQCFREEAKKMGFQKYS